ncbi:unnamed protein product, partial [marine sediment metagenome]
MDIQPLLISLTGIVLASTINYLLFRRLFKNQAKDILTLFGETEEGKEVKDLLHRLSEYTKSEDATKMGEDLKSIVENVKHFTSFKLTLSGNPGEDLINLPKKPETEKTLS